MQAPRHRDYDAHGADVSDDMLKQAARRLGGREGLPAWRMGEGARRTDEAEMASQTA